METYTFPIKFQVTINPDKMPVSRKLIYELDSEQNKLQIAIDSAVSILENYLSEMNQNWTWAKLDVVNKATTSTHNNN